MTDYLTDHGHLLVSGVTGARSAYGGKTAWATWWCDTWGREGFDVVLFLNFKQDDGPEEHADAVARSLVEVGDALREGATFVCFTPDRSDWSAVHAEVREFVEALDDGTEKAVVHDEAPEYDDEALRWFVRVAGNGSNCKSILLAQSPGDLSMKVRRQTVLVWVGPTTADNRHVFDSGKLGGHFDWVTEHHEPYWWSVLLGPDPEDRDTYRPVPEVYAG